MGEENWKDVVGYEGIYKISTLGRIKNSKNKIIKQYKNHKGYLITQLSKCKDKKTFIVHRLVAGTFIPNPENKPQVNHINCNKEDNRVVNLEWVTNNENKLHAKENGLCKAIKGGQNPLAKKINQYDLDGNLIKKWDCINDVVRCFDLKTGANICECCKGNLKTAYGYIWKYAEN